MEIRTKFKPKDKIWVVIWSVGYHIEERTVYEIIIMGKDNIYYTDEKFFSANGYELERYDENSCFATKEKAQAECDKRNKGE